MPWPGFQGAGKAPAFAKKLSSPPRGFLPSLKYTPAHHERFLPWVKGRPLSNYHFLVAKTHVTLLAVCPLLRVVRTSSGVKPDGAVKAKGHAPGALSRPEGREEASETQPAFAKWAWRDPSPQVPSPQAGK